MHFTVLYGSHRTERQGIKGARFVEAQLKNRGHEVYFADSMALGLPLLDKRYMDYEKGQAPNDLEELAEIYRNTDGFVIVTGEYNQTMPPGLVNLLDYFYHEYAYRPSAIASYSVGPFGGIRASVQLRSVLCELGMSPIPTVFPMSQVDKAFDEDGTALDEAYLKRITKFLDTLEWYASALKAQRALGTP